MTTIVQLGRVVAKITGARGPIGLDIVTPEDERAGKILQFVAGPGGRRVVAVTAVAAGGADNTLREELQEDTGAELVAHDGVTVAVVLNQISVVPEQFGALGNNTTDDSDAFADALTFLSNLGGGALRCRAGATYKLVIPPIVPDNCTLDLNGCTLRLAYAASSGLPGIRVRNNSRVINGRIKAEWPGDDDANYNIYGNILVGEQHAVGGAIASYTGWHLENLILENDRTDDTGGQGILCFGGANNGTIKNITFPDSNGFGAAIRLTWQGNGGNPPTISGHPNNIVIDTIKFGKMTHQGGEDTCGIDLVALYNIRISNVTCEEHRWAGLVAIRTGAFGPAVGPDAAKNAFMEGIDIKSVSCAKSRTRLFIINGRSHGDGVVIPETFYPIPALISGCSAAGAGGDSETAGVEITNTSGVEFFNCTMKRLFRGFFVQENVQDITFTKCKAIENWHEGFIAAHSTHSPEDIRYVRCEAHSNGQSGTDARGFHAEACLRVTWDNCVAGIAGDTHQTVGFYVDASAVETRIVGRNRVRAVASGGVARQFNGPVLGDIKFSGGSSAALPTAGPYREAPLSGLGLNLGDGRQAVMLQKMMLTNFRVRYEVAPGAGASRSARVVVNGAGTALFPVTSGTDNLAHSYETAEVPEDADVVVLTDVTGTAVSSHAIWSCEGFLV